MREDVDLVNAYLSSARGAQEGRGLSVHRRAVRTQLMELARHVLPSGGDLWARYEEIDAALAMGADVSGALGKERALLVDDVLPFLIGLLDDVELQALQADFEQARSS